MKTKEVFIWDIVTEILENHGDFVADVSIHEHDEYVDICRKIYCSDGYCFELKKETVCDPDEVNETAVEGLEPDGCVYSYDEPWDGFKEAGIDKAIEILNAYAGLKNE